MIGKTAMNAYGKIAVKTEGSNMAGQKFQRAGICIFAAAPTFLLAAGGSTIMDKHFSSIRIALNRSSQKGSQKMCKGCGQPATKEALFEVGNGVTLIERYCDKCVQAVQADNKGSA
jgi:hypothetical protein